MSISQANFFPESVRTEIEALSFVKKLTAISISTILYHRGMFPAQDYCVRTQSGKLLHILDRKAETPAAKRIVDLVASTFTAIDKKLLNTIVIGIVDDPNKPDQFLESYTIKLQYFDEIQAGDSTRYESGSDRMPLAEQALQLLEELKRVTGNIKRVNKDLYFTMRLLFCDESADGYEPKGFTTKPVAEFEIKGSSHPHRCGQIRTKFNGFRLKAETNVQICSS